MTNKPGQTQEVGIAGSKDAFHCPAVLVCSSQIVVPGQRVNFQDKTLRHVKVDIHGNGHGVADPFLNEPIQPGTYFWVLLMPETTKNLSHHFDVVVEGLVDEAPVGITHSEAMAKLMAEIADLKDDDEFDECAHCNL